MESRRVTQLLKFIGGGGDRERVILSLEVKILSTDYTLKMVSANVISLFLKLFKRSASTE